MTSVTFHPEARVELRAAVRFYHEEAPGLARSFAAEVRATVERLAEFPGSGSLASSADGVRRVLLDRFPFCLVYQGQSDLIEILAVMHQRRRPEYWRDRLD